MGTDEAVSVKGKLPTCFINQPIPAKHPYLGVLEVHHIKLQANVMAQFLRWQIFIVFPIGIDYMVHATAGKELTLGTSKFSKLLGSKFALSVSAKI